jgi:hypothetical protein
MTMKITMAPPPVAALVAIPLSGPEPDPRLQLAGAPGEEQIRLFGQTAGALIWRIMHRRSFLVVALACGFLVPRVAGAQAQAAQTLRGLDSAAFVRLAGRVNAAARIRTLYAGRRLMLYRPHLAPGLLAYDSLTPRPVDTPLSLWSIDRIEVPRSRAGDLAVEGAILGGSVGALYGALSQYHPCIGGLGGSCAPRPPFDGNQVVRGTLVGVLVGGVLGAMFGAGTPGWRLVYAAPR